jgi:hypothetical protein
MQTEWQSSICRCTLSDLKDHLKAQELPLYAGDLIELVNSQPFGIGVRALHRFGSCSLLAEAIGEIYPPKIPLITTNTRMLADTHQSSFPLKSGKLIGRKVIEGFDFTLTTQYTRLTQSSSVTGRDI